MPESSFSVKGNSVIRVRLEPTDITGMGSPAYPQLILGLKLQLFPLWPTNYTLLRIDGKMFVSNENAALATLEHAPMAEESSPQPYDRAVNVAVPLTLTQIRHLEELRGGGNLLLRFALSGLVALNPGIEFERLQDSSLQVYVPRSHWIDSALNVWKVSELRLLEINPPEHNPKEIALAQVRLADAEQLYRTGDYPHVLTELRLAFAAVAERYSAKRTDRSMFEQILVNTHPAVREKLASAFDSFYRFLHLGPHEPSPTPGVEAPISRHDARLALIIAHAILEYFSSENWPGI